MARKGKHFSNVYHEALPLITNESSGKTYITQGISKGKGENEILSRISQNIPNGLCLVFDDHHDIWISCKVSPMSSLLFFTLKIIVIVLSLMCHCYAIAKLEMGVVIFFSEKLQ